MKISADSVTAGTLVGGGMFGGWYGWHMMDGRMSGWMVLGMIFWAVVLVGVVVLTVRAFRRPGAGGDGETALEILKKRYARGEISREEFEAMKKDIS
jgi:putative membrane protein